MVLQYSYSDMEDEDEENLLPDETQDGPTWVMAGVGMDGPRDDFFFSAVAMRLGTFHVACRTDVSESLRLARQREVTAKRRKEVPSGCYFW